MFLPYIERFLATFEEERTVFSWALTFLIIALISAAFGFGGMASASAGVAQVLFLVFFLLFVGAVLARIVKDDRRT